MSTKLLVTASLTLLLFGCIKTQSKRSQSATDVLIAQAHDYFIKSIEKNGPYAKSGNYRANQPRTVQWDQATQQHLPTGDVVLVPIVYNNKLLVSLKSSPYIAYDLSQLTTLTIAKDTIGHFESAVITFIPDTIYAANSPSGLYLVEDWQGTSYTNPIHIGPGTAVSAESISGPTNRKESDTYEVQTCYEIDGYNYTPDDPSGGETWSETTCSTETYSSPQVLTSPLTNPATLGSIHGTRIVAPLTINLYPPRNPIGNIADYLKCFTPSDAADHKFTVALAVEQPVSGSREPWTFTQGGVNGSSQTGNPVNVGHTWLIFTEATAYGTTTRNVGFYPSSRISPLSPSSQGILADDEGTDYDISLTITVSSSQFFTILNYVSQGNSSGYMYDLNSNNCTTFALDALDAGNVAVPATIGTWIMNGKGLDPGDLGEDIRGLQLPNNMTRSTVSNAHPNQGSCN